MVATVIGSRLGLEQTSAWVLGSRGQFGSSALGRAGEGVTVNAMTGNLVVTNQDEFLIGQGPDSAISRAYNSQGSLDGDNNDGWRVGSRRVTVSGGVPVRTDWDGSVITYVSTGTNTYRTTEGAGAYDTLELVAGKWIWTDGDSRVSETYETYDGGTNFRITKRSDTDGNSLTFTYTGAGLISRITTQDGAYTDFTWSGSNLTQLVSAYRDPSASATWLTQTRTRYAYDGLNRLTSVTVDLSPTDNAVGDGGTYVTTYTYDGTSTRVASISQTDGSRIDIAYEAGGTYRVTSITQSVTAGVSRTTSYTYVTSARTDVTDPGGRVTSLEYNAAGELTKITEPAATAGGTPQVREFSYDVHGNVIRVKTSATTWTDYLYDDANGDGTGGDHNGLWTHQYQRAAATSHLAARRTYNAANAVLTETRYQGPDPDGPGAGQASAPLTTRYAYDSENHLRFLVSANGDVTRYDYRPDGQLIRTTQYGVDFDLAYEALTPGSVRTTGQSWTVRDGDTLQGMAAATWGDASLWYLIAEANGLTSASILTAGQTLTIPARAGNVHNNADTFRPYDPNEALGNLNPTQPKPPKKAGGCGMIGQIIMVVIAVAVAAVVLGPAMAGAANAFASAGLGTTVATGASAAASATIAGTTIAAGSAAGIAGAIAGGAIAGAAGSIASQLFGVATGIQDKFDWKGVGISAIAGGIGGGLGRVGSLANRVKDLAGNIGRGFIRGALSNVLTQGVATATGLQHKFDWTGVAVGAVVGGTMAGIDTLTGNVSGMVGDTAYIAPSAFSAEGIRNSLAAGAAGAVAGAATRSMMQGTSFGDNLLAALPDVIGNTIGSAIGTQIVEKQMQSTWEREQADLEAEIREAEYEANAPVRAQVQAWMDEAMGPFDQASFPELREWEAVLAYHMNAQEERMRPPELGVDDAATEAIMRRSGTTRTVQGSSGTGRLAPQDYFALLDGQIDGSVWSLNLQPIKGGYVGQLGADYFDAPNRNIHKGVEGQVSFGSDTSDWYALFEVYQGEQTHPRFAVANLTQNTISEDFSLYPGLQRTVNGLHINVPSHPSEGDPLALFWESAIVAMSDLGEAAVYTAQHPGAVVESLARSAVYTANPANWDEITHNALEGARAERDEAVAAYRNGTLLDYAARKAGSALPDVLAGLASGGSAVVLKRTVQTAVVSAVRREVRQSAVDTALTAGRGISPSRAGGPFASSPVSGRSPVGMRSTENPIACFVAGTLIHTSEGLRPIESLRLGDQVLSQPEITGEIGYRRIVRTFAFDNKPVFKVTYQNASGRQETLTATPNHPFWVKGEGWTAVENLECGHILEREDRADVTVLEIVDEGESAKVFNFEVDGFHTYYVGETGIWVHNDDCGGERYNRRKHYGYTPSKADRKAFGAGPDEVVDHSPPLLVRWLFGDRARGEKPGMFMTREERLASARDTTRMKLQSRTESNKQGALMSQLSNLFRR